MKEREILKILQDISQRTGAINLDDDAAILQNLVISTDQFIEDTHFRWHFHKNAQEIGYKGVVQSLSDLAAMATKPSGILLSAALCKTHKNQWPALFAGVEQACLDYQVPLIGGDLTESQALTYLDFVVLGFNEEPVRKSGARPGDLLAVTGLLGSAAAGFMSLEKKIQAHEFENAFIKPKAHIQTALSLAKTGKLTSLTDISDSLSKSVFDLHKHSHCGFEIDFAKIPHPEMLKSFCKELQLDLQQFLLHGGEDYQLLMTLAPQSSEKVISDHSLTVIGRANVEQGCSLILDGKKTSLTEVGWDPFDLKK